MVLWPLVVMGELPVLEPESSERRMNLRWDSSMNSAVGAKRSGLRGARTRRALGKSPWTTPKTRRARGSSVATTLPATISGARPRRGRFFLGPFAGGGGGGGLEMVFGVAPEG